MVLQQMAETDALVFGHKRLRSNSILSGLVLFVNPSRCERRMTWVSTPMVCWPKALPSTILAVFRPTPGRVSRSSSLSGTLPLKRLTISLQQL